MFLNDGSGGFGGAAGAAGDTVGGGGDGSGELGSSRRAIRRACAYFEGYWRYRAGLPALRRVVRDGFGVVGRGMGVWWVGVGEVKGWGEEEEGMGRLVDEGEGLDEGFVAEKEDEGLAVEKEQEGGLG